MNDRLKNGERKEIAQTNIALPIIFIHVFGRLSAQMNFIELCIMHDIYYVYAVGVVRHRSDLSPQSKMFLLSINY